VILAAVVPVTAKLVVARERAEPALAAGAFPWLPVTAQFDLLRLRDADLGSSGALAEAVEH